MQRHESDVEVRDQKALRSAHTEIRESLDQTYPTSKPTMRSLLLTELSISDSDILAEKNPTMIGPGKTENEFP